MKTITKFLLGAAGAGALYAFYKYGSTKDAFYALKPKIVKINNVKATLSAVSVNFDVMIENTSNFDLGISSFKTFALKQVQLFNKKTNSILGIADVNISDLNIAAQNSTIIKNINTTVPITSLLQNYNALSTNPADYKILLIIEAMGKDYTVDSEIFM